MSEINQKVKPESQSIRDCSSLRENCQNKILGKMDKQHEIQMLAIEKINISIAYMKGQSDPKVLNATNSVKKNGKRDWIDIVIRMMIAWAPGLVILMILGIVALLKSKNYL